MPIVQWLASHAIIETTLAYCTQNNDEAARFAILNPAKQYDHLCSSS